MEHTSARADTGLFMVRETHYLDSLDTSHLQVARQHDGEFRNEHVTWHLRGACVMCPAPAFSDHLEMLNRPGTTDETRDLRRHRRSCVVRHGVER